MGGNKEQDKRTQIHGTFIHEKPTKIFSSEVNTYLSQRLQFALHHKIEVTKFTVLSVRTLDPLLKAFLMDVF